ncbi:hypothetical protein CHS0354_003781, partial [Potamilus streckersoni]
AYKLVVILIALHVFSSEIFRIGKDYIKKYTFIRRISSPYQEGGATVKKIVSF